MPIRQLIKIVANERARIITKNVLIKYGNLSIESLNPTFHSILPTIAILLFLGKKSDSDVAEVMLLIFATSTIAFLNL